MMKDSFIFVFSLPFPGEKKNTNTKLHTDKKKELSREEFKRPTSNIQLGKTEI